MNSYNEQTPKIHFMDNFPISALFCYIEKGLIKPATVSESEQSPQDLWTGYTTNGMVHGPHMHIETYTQN